MLEFWSDFLRYTALAILWLIFLPITLILGLVLAIDWLFNHHKENIEENMKDGQ